MKIRFTILGVVLALLITAGVTYITADQPAPLDIKDPALGQSDLRFIENKGQWESIIRYRVRLNGGDVFVENNRLTYYFYDMPHEGHGLPALDARPASEKQFRSHTYRMEFVHANSQSPIVPQLLYPQIHNYYYGNDPSKWAENVGLYGLLTYKDLYSGIDLRLYGFGDALKYDFIVQPGADPASIKLNYEGTDKIYLDKGALHIKTSLRETTELPPVAYQEIDGQKREVRCEFRLKGSLLTYHFPNGYDPLFPLVIDPTLIFSTYTGSHADNWGFTATYDDLGNAYAGGFVWSNAFNSSYPTTVGAFQTTFQGGDSDVTLSKFSPNGSNLLFSTYLGGNTSEQPHSLVADNLGNLYVYGRTNSVNFPTTQGAFDNTKSTGFDIFIAKISSTGGLLASTFVGGNADDGVNGSAGYNPLVFTTTKHNYGDDARGEIILDDQGNCFVAAQTNSTNFPGTAGHAQPAIGGGQDGIIFKMNNNLSAITWATYLGGSSADAAYTMKLDTADNVYVAGGTSSSNFPANTYNTTYRGGTTDGFVAKISSNGNVILSSTFIGTASYDQVYLLDLDKDFNVYVCGQSNGNYPILNPPSGPVYSNNNAKQFIVKLQNNLSAPIFSTVFGSVNAAGPNISPTAMLVDRCDNIYVSGWGGSTNTSGSVIGMPITSDAFDPNPNDGSDFYMIVLSRDVQSLIYATFLGGDNTAATSAGDHVDGGTSRFDKNGVVYHAVCAGCWGNSSFPAQPSSVWSPTNGANGIAGLSANGCNLAIFKMSFDLAGIEADFVPLDQFNQPIVSTQGCAPLTVNFDNTSFLGSVPGIPAYLWNFDDNGATSSLFEPTHVFQNAGTYNVMLILTDSASCNISDTVFRTIVVFPPPDVDAGPDVNTCAGDTITLQSSDPFISYQWSPSTGLISPDSLQQVSVVPPSSGQYILTVTDVNGCEAQDTVAVFVDNTFKVTARPDSVVCRGGSFLLNAGSNGGILYEWTSLPQANISNPAIANPAVANLDTTTMFYIRSENALGCESLDSVRIEVFEVFTLEDTFVCDGNSILLQTNNGVSWIWTPNNGTLSSTTISSPVASPLATTTYTVTATSADGCISTKDILVEVLPNPVAEAGRDIEICWGDSTLLQASGGVSYQWTPATGLSDPTVANPVATPVLTTTYYVTVTDLNGCEDTDSVRVQVNALPPVNAGEDATICQGETFQLRATGAGSYQWRPENTLSNPLLPNPIASPVNSTLYIVNGLDANGCRNVDSVLISVVPRPVTQIEGINQICVGGSIVLTASGGDTYLWSTGDTTPSISVLPNQTTTYYATAFVGLCEGTPDSITVDARFGYPNASFTFSPNPGWAPEEVVFQNTSTGASYYLWDFGFGQNSDEENPSHKFPSAGTYRVMLIAFSAQGCPDTVWQDLLLENVALHAPSGFTPNADGINDFFKVGYYGIGSLNVKIFSRWGTKIFESDDRDFLWDGTYQGVAVPEGVYVYVITGVGENDLNYERKGTVTLIR
ncbi:MAG: PKD domain-containing protein [Bacteroidia bacterium]|nr:PKD domain-containing protein [Bacteroidia bacterium]